MLINRYQAKMVLTLSDHVTGRQQSFIYNWPTKNEEANL